MGNRRTKIKQADALFLHMREPRNWWERYCSHVLEPGQYVVVSIVLLVFFLAFGVFMFVESRPLRLEKLGRLELTFVDCTEDEDGFIVLRADGYTGTFTFIADADALEDTLLQACKTGDVFTAFVEYYERPDNYNIAVLVSPEGSELVTLADTNAAIRTERIVLMAVSAGFLLLWAAFSFGMFYVGAYPERHPRLVRLLYKEGSVYF